MPVPRDSGGGSGAGWWRLPGTARPAARGAASQWVKGAGFPAEKPRSTCTESLIPAMGPPSVPRPRTPVRIRTITQPFSNGQVKPASCGLLFPCPSLPRPATGADCTFSAPKPVKFPGQSDSWGSEGMPDGGPGTMPDPHGEGRPGSGTGPPQGMTISHVEGGNRSPSVRPGTQASRTASISSESSISLETRMPPVSRAMFQVSPQSSRLIFPRAENTVRSPPQGSRA